MTHVKATDARIAFVGRTLRKNNTVLFDWAGVEVRFGFKGERFTLLMDGGGSDYNIVVDGALLQILRPEQGIAEHVITLPVGSDQDEHLVIIQRRNDAHFGVTTFKGLKLVKGAQLLSKPEMKIRKIEFIGDSYTVGYGNEGPSTECDSLRPYENNALSFAAITARALTAEAHMTAVSGRGLVRNYGDKERTSKEPMPDLYDRVLFHNENERWDFSQWQADAVVVKLGTNDFSTEPHPDHDYFKRALSELLTRVTANYGDVPVFLLADLSLPVVVALYRDYHQANSAQSNSLYFIELPKPTQDQLGCDWHPSVEFHQQAASVLTPIIKSRLGW